MRIFSLFKLRLRMDVDQLVTYGVTITAVALAIGYQVLDRKVKDADSEPRSRP